MSHNPFATVNDATKEIQSSVRQIGVPASAVYQGVIKAAYMIKNNWNDKQVDLVLDIELSNGYNYKIQKGVLREGSPMVANPKTKKQELMYTYVQMSHIVGAAIPGATIADVFGSIENKKIELYDFEAKKDVLTEVKMVTDLVGKELLLGLQRKISNKRDKQGDDWIDLPESKETLEFGAAASIADRRTFTEINNNVAPEDAADLDKWEKLNAGKDWNAYKKVGPVASGLPAGVKAAAEEEVYDFSNEFG